MLRVCALCLLFVKIGVSMQIFVDSGNHKIASCILNIIEANYKPNSQLTIITDENDDQIVAAINRMSFVSIQLFNSTAKVFNAVFNSGYLIFASNCEDFAKKVNRITMEISWNTDANMLVFYKNGHELKCIFDVLLKKRIVNVVILNESSSLYTYNPFEDFGCGKRYNKIIKVGHCSGQRLFYNKLVTGLQNCTFRVLSKHLPPYSIAPASKESEYQGSEQYILTLLADKERFKLNFAYEMDADEFSVIAENRTAVGSLRALQNGDVDIINGAMLLTENRASAFVYLTGGLAFTDYLQIFVAKNRAISNLKTIYSRFQWTIWLALFVVFVVYSVLMHLIMRRQPKQNVNLKMFGFLLQQSSRHKYKRIFIFWIVFSYLISCCYLSSLVSFTLEPHANNQISSLDDILEYGLEPCISYGIRRVAGISGNGFFLKDGGEGCEGRAESLNIVANTNNRFTVYPYTLFSYHKSEYYDEFGDFKIYAIAYPKAQMLYAIYMYKEFPLMGKLQNYCLRIEEAGLIKQRFSLLSIEKIKKLSFISKRKIAYFFIPWHVLGFGVALSTLVLCLEIVIYKCK